ncbi:MAG: TonB-dependent receptor [Bradyrhizobium sp.]|nr:TonB-dependent receptor [Bradyrhizobium sp.]
MINNIVVNRKRLLSMLLASSVLAPQLAHAQTAGASSDTTAPASPQKPPITAAAAPLSDTQIADIIVTANKREQLSSEVGLTIATLGADTLERQRVRDLSDLASQVPGLSFAPTEFTTPVFVLRGVGFYDKSIGGYPTTSVYVDEVPLPFPVYATHANLDVARVEVLKGPQGTLFGQNSTGGAINFIAAKPTNTFSAGAFGTIGRFGRGELGGYVSGPLTGNLNARLAVQHDFGSGWQYSYTRKDTPLGTVDVTNARLLLDWEPTDRLKFQLNVNGWRDKTEPQVGKFIALFPQVSLGPVSAVNPKVAVYPFAPNSPTAADWSPDARPRANRQQYQAALRGDFDLSDNVVLTSITSYIDHKVDQLLDVDSTSTNLLLYADVGSAKTFTQELRVAGKNGPFQWVVGGNYEYSKTFEETYQSYFDSSNFTVLQSGQGQSYVDQKYKNYAIFANGEYRITDGLTFKLGGRYTNSEVNAKECTFDAGDGTVNNIIRFLYGAINPGKPVPNLQIGDCITFLQNNEPGLFVDTLKEDNFSWRVGLDYKVSPSLLLYVNVAKGYKGGSYPAVPAVTYISYLPVVQEGLLDYEGGFKATLFDRRLNVNGAVFFYKYDNKQVLTRQPDPLVGTVNALDNIDKSEVKGAELEVTAVPIRGLRLTGGLTYLDAKITKYVGVNAATILADFAGTPIPFTPKWQYLISADYDVPTSDNVQPFFGATFGGRTKTTSIVGDASGAIIRPGYRSSVPLADTYKVAGYNLLDLRVGLQSTDDSWRMMAWIKNVTNKTYTTNVATAFESVTRYVGMPRTYGVTVSYKFQ